MQITWTERSYPVFLYARIIFFIVHLLIYGLGLDQSYFGLLLVYIGYYKININQWILVLLWLGTLLELTNLGKIIYKKYIKSEEEDEDTDHEDTDEDTDEEEAD